VETAEQFHTLRGLGVDAYQGWLFAKALDASTFRALLSGPPLPVPAGEPPAPPDGLRTQALRTTSGRDWADPGQPGAVLSGANQLSGAPSGASQLGGAPSGSGQLAGAPAGSGHVGSAPASPGPLGGFGGTPDEFATPIADLLASLLTSRDPDPCGGPDGGGATDAGDPPVRR
jgi:hypothetical protein